MANGPVRMEVRRAGDADGDRVREGLGAGAPDPRGANPVLICERDGEVVAAGMLVMAGGPTEPGVARLESLVGAPGLAGEVWADVMAALIRAASAQIREAGRQRMIVPVGVTETGMTKVAESCGLRPTETGPYRPLGPGAFEPLMGYTGPEGYQIDYAGVV